MRFKYDITQKHDAYGKFHKEEKKINKKFCPDMLVSLSDAGHVCPLLIIHFLTTFEKRNLST